MASEIDEAAAVEWHEWTAGNRVGRLPACDEESAARAALRWKARAEAAEAERDSLKRQLAQSVKAR